MKRVLVLDLGGEALRLELAPCLVQAAQRFHPRHQLLAPDGLVEEIVGAGLDALQPAFAVLERSDQHHRDERRQRAGLQPPADLEAARSGKHHVEQDEVGRRVGDRGDCRLAVAHHLGLHALGFDDGSEQRRHVRIVVDHQHAERRLRRKIPAGGGEITHT
jgi:hypothetical protein